MPKVLDQHGKPIRAKRTAGRVVRVRGGYAAAQTDSKSSELWPLQDHLSAREANDPNVRKQLRERARNEADNSPYLAGLIDTIANDVVGTGPRLELEIPNVPSESCAIIERMFAQWCLQTDLAEDLRTLHKSRIRDGEGFGLAIINDKLDPFLPQLDLKVYETDQIATPDIFRYSGDLRRVDGIIFDRHGNPDEYHFLKAHPGGNSFAFGEYDRIAADKVFHWFRPARAGQARGVPDITPALPLFALDRRYLLAVVKTAENQAALTAVLETDLPAPSEDDGDGEEASAWERIEWEHDALMTLPNKAKLNYPNPSQPSSTYGDFSTRLLKAEGRAASAPLNVISGSSEGYNYSSAKVDLGRYYRTCKIDRHRMRTKILDRLFRAWLFEAFHLDILPANLPPIAHWGWEWHWDGFESIDPVKDATANQIMLESGQITLSEIYAGRNLGWERQLRQRAREIELQRELGISAQPGAGVIYTPGPDNEDGSSGDPVANPQQPQSTGGGVQATALNGAQVTSLLLVADKVAADLYPPDVAKAIMYAAFPAISRKIIDDIIDGLAAYDPPTPTPTEPTDQATAESEAANAA